ncbi:MAG: hypothetical protein KC912_13815 [Proteobacteria bacterium]|nr:hypothetical protein [Pseudomonadota bacterium]
MRHHPSHRRGTYSAIFGITASVMLGFTAIGVDVGWQRLAMTQLANAADAGAHAGAMLLDGTDAGVTAAELRALSIAQANKVHGSSVALDSADIVVGRYDVVGENDCTNNDGCWTEMGGTPTGYASGTNHPAVTAIDANAVYVGAQEDVTTIFAGFPFGKSSVTAANYAIARLPIVEQPGIPCAFPMSIPECSMTDWMDEAPCGSLIRMQWSPAGSDNVGWSYTGGGGANTIKNALATVDGDCTNAHDADDIDDGTAAMTLQNGNVASAQAIIAAQLAGGTATVNGVPYDYSTLPEGWQAEWGACPTNVSDVCDTSTQGNHCPANPPDCDPNGSDVMIKRAITVFNRNDFSCDSYGNVTSGAQFNQSATPSGYVNMIIYNIEEVSSGSPSNRYGFMDAYISCTDEDGNLRDENNDGIGDVVHQGEADPEIDEPEEGTLAIVE